MIYKSLVCIKFLQIIIFPESPQTFTWGESQNSGGPGGEEGSTLNVKVIGMLVRKYPNCWRNKKEKQKFVRYSGGFVISRVLFSEFDCG